MVPHYLSRMAHQASVVRIAAVPARELPPLQAYVFDGVRPAIVRDTVANHAPDSEPALKLLASSLTEQREQ